MRVLHMSIRTEKAYVQWIEQFLRFHRDRNGAWTHPDDSGKQDIDTSALWQAPVDLIKNAAELLRLKAFIGFAVSPTGHRPILL